MVTLDVEGVQGLFDIVHAKIFVPNPKPVIDVVGDNELLIVPLPETKVHKPVPTVGVFALMIVLGEEIQMVWVAPAFAIVGT